MKREATRIVQVIGALVATTLLVSCSSGNSDGSNTPRITLGNDESDLSSYLLTGADVRVIDGFAQSVVTEFDEVPVFENPDPRGPCGGVVPALDFAGAVGRAFAGTSSTTVTLVVESDVKQQSYLQAFQADVNGACGPYTSTTNTGQTQTVSDITVLTFPVAGVEAIGWTSKIEIGPQSGYAGMWLFEAEGRVAFIQYQGLEPVSELAMVALAEGAYSRLTQ